MHNGKQVMGRRPLKKTKKTKKESNNDTIDGNDYDSSPMSLVTAAASISKQILPEYSLWLG